MTILLISDVHANLEALEAVLADSPAFDRVWFLGDAVGYGPDPNGCVDRLRALEPQVWLAGNHDWAALGRLDTSTFNPEARFAADWTDRALRDDVRAFLEDVEPRQDRPDDGATLVHGSPRHPIWEYIVDAGIAAENFEAFETPLCLYGHTHVPIVFEEGVDGAARVAYTLSKPLKLEGLRALVNPGSVGQPRDGDPRASYALLDLDARCITFRRVAYDIKAVQKKILAAGLPHRLAARLDYGW
jgi:diadenosine tetraphosphatase ApaH/serine/threonine PP2A family protein phosphatase